MFICESCGTQMESGIAPIRVVTHYREKIYPQRTTEAMVENEDTGYIKKATVITDRGGKGIETVKEINACAKCAKTIKPVLVGPRSPYRMG